MASVPNTDTFTLQDVVNAVAGGVTSLQASFNLAQDILFDPAYKGSKNSLLNFRNFNASNFTLTLSISSYTFPRGGGSTSFTITTQAGNSWVASVGSAGAWLHLSSTSGSGSRTITITCDASTYGRSGSILVTSSVPSKSISITQS